ncbi:PREDICTED: putative gustatory receptor 28b [Vollenhovia emeryi]|uniref:putative gustatory receptor 28b n=1 Tax=Vollenhovia emeryi TaxID=411798 RepID=UPI0005F37DAA|nr:PREDICTED: putative gustatory receptor 28b [Vollenhovia emeryi]
MFNPSLKFQVLQDERNRKRCLLFRATDFASLMYPCFTVCRILGIFSYKFNAANIKTYKPSYILSTITCFKQINDNLVNLREVLTNGEPYLLNGASRNQRNPFLLMKITALKKQHLSISDSVRMLKMVYSLQLVSTILMAFTHITFNMYFYFLALVQKSVPLTSVEKQVLYEYFITFIMYYIIKIALMVWACETGKNQAREITTTIYNVVNSTNNKQIKYELELFYLQLLHCENVFSAKWITIDAKLLTAIIGSITTYLLILLQFLFTPHSCSGKST